MKTRDILATFNRGLIGRMAVARVDVERVRLSAEEQTNWLPRVLGPMSLRPGMKKHGPGATVGGDGSYIPFVFSRDDTAILELSSFGMRIWDDGETRVSRPTVAATITNGTFDSDLSGWTSADEAGASSIWSAGDTYFRYDIVSVKELDKVQLVDAIWNNREKRREDPFLSLRLMHGEETHLLLALDNDERASVMAFAKAVTTARNPEK